MNNTGRKIEWLVWMGLLVITTSVLLLFIFALLRQKGALGKTPPALPVIAEVGGFTLTNQVGSVVTLNELKGRVWVADIIFTRCAGPCPRMTRQMRELQDALPSSGGIQLVTLTTDPTFDTPPVMRAYAEKFGADFGRWMFLTGTKDQIARLAVDSLKLTAVEKDPQSRESPQDLFIHSTIFVVVDKQSRLRGVYETSGDGIEFGQVKRQILAAVQRLEREP